MMSSPSAAPSDASAETAAPEAEAVLFAACQQCQQQLAVSAPEAAESARLEEQLLAGAAPPPLSMEGSYIVLPGGGGLSAAAAGPADAGGRFTVSERIAAAARVLALAADTSGAEQPLCADCAADVTREVEAELADAQREAAAYAALAERAAAEAAEGGEGGARAARAAAEHAAADAAAERGRLAALEAALAAAEAEEAALATGAARLDALEARYWDVAAALELAAAAAADERDALAARLAAAEAALAALRRTNALAAAFRIWRDGPIGTISGLRVGRTAEAPVGWPEINAGLGQAALLLDTLARMVGAALPHRVEPRGSAARVGGDPLHGPANKYYYAAPFDRALVAFLANIQALAVKLAAEGATRRRGGAPEPFSLEFPIAGDRVGGHCVRFVLARDEHWTRALKYALVNLKFCLKVSSAASLGRPVEAENIQPSDEPTSQPTQ
jgi:beclin 1